MHWLMQFVMELETKILLGLIRLAVARALSVGVLFGRAIVDHIWLLHQLVAEKSLGCSL